MVLRDRVEAGKMLASALGQYRDADAVVYALPRGGVILGAEVAKALHLPLDLLIPRKIGHPANPEYAICAISGEEGIVCNEVERAQVDAHWFEHAVAHERQEAARRRQLYLGDHAPVPVEGKTAILVDDGIATGLTMRAAIAEVRQRQPGRIVIAVPVIPPDTAARLRSEADEVIAVDIPEFFLGAIGAYYLDFHPISDDEVRQALQEVWS